MEVPVAGYIARVHFGLALAAPMVAHPRLFVAHASGDDFAARVGRYLGQRGSIRLLQSVPPLAKVNLPSDVIASELRRDLRSGSGGA